MSVHRIFLDSVVLYMSDMVHQHGYESINIDDPVEEFYMSYS